MAILADKIQKLDKGKLKNSESYLELFLADILWYIFLLPPS